MCRRVIEIDQLEARKVANLVARFKAVKGRGPTRAGLVAALGWDPKEGRQRITSLYQRLWRLRRGGWVWFTDKERSLDVGKAARHAFKQQVAETQRTA